MDLDLDLEMPVLDDLNNVDWDSYVDLDTTSTQEQVQGNGGVEWVWWRRMEVGQ